MDEGRNGDRDWEALKLYFDFFKHFTTLTTAAGLLFLALVRGLDLHTEGAVFGLTMLAGALFLSLIGLLTLLSWVGRGVEARPGFWTFVLAAFVVGFFFAGTVALIAS